MINVGTAGPVRLAVLLALVAAGALLARRVSRHGARADDAEPEPVPAFEG
jgi:hypothetical protein